MGERDRNTKDRTRVQLTWRNKDRSLLNHGASTYEWVDPTDWRVSEVRLLEEIETVGDPDQNLLIEGDALYALTSLASIPEYADKYKGKIKLCYIDPPFNTRQTFANYKDSLENSVWLTMFRDRLRQIKELLAPEGTIWVHLDDEQAHRARVVLDEIFGIENFVDCLAVEQNPKGRQLDPFFAGSHDSVTVYAADITKCDITPTSRGLVNIKDYKERTEDGTPFRYLPLRNTNKSFNPDTRPNLYYPLYVDEATGNVSVEAAKGLTEVYPVFGDGSPAVWRWGKPLATRQPDQMFGKSVRGLQGERLDVFQIDILTDDKQKKMKSMWLSSDIGSTDEGKAELKALGIEGFATPKPERLMRRIIEAATKPGDIVLDCFAGSGTTAAVAHKLNRRWVTIELEGKSIDDYIKPRMTAIVDGTDTGGISVETTEDLIAELPEGTTPTEVRQAARTLTDIAAAGAYEDFPKPTKKNADTPYGQILTAIEADPGVIDMIVKELAKQTKAAAKTVKTVKPIWEGGGGFTHVAVGPSLFEDAGGVIVLADWAHDGALAEAVSAQMRFPYKPQAPFAGQKGRQKLAVIDGMCTPSLVDYLLGYTNENETIIVVAQSLSPDVTEYLRDQRKGSRARKVPRDLAKISKHTERVTLVNLPVEGNDSEQFPS